LYLADDFYLNKCCELKQRFLHVRHGVDQTIIDNAIDEWRGRLRACVRAKGGHDCGTIQPYNETFRLFFLSNAAQFSDFFMEITTNSNF